MLIPNPNLFYPGSRNQGQKDSRIRIKEFKLFKPKILFLNSLKYDIKYLFIPDPDLDGSRIRIPNTAYGKEGDRESERWLLLCDCH
jgi:hypothetical protein